MPGAASAPDLDLARHLAYALQLNLGLVFLLAAIPKVRDPAAFTRTVVEYRVLPRAVAAILAPATIAGELFLGLAFLSGWLTEVALPVAGALLVAFSAAVAINLRRGQRVPCGCFGAASERISARSLVRLGLLLAGVVVLVVMPAAEITVASLADEGVLVLAYLVEVGSVALFLILAATWLLSWPELAFTLRRLGRLETR
jgi:putative oxidoreductase